MEIANEAIQITQFTEKESRSFLILGSGISGLSCAVQLSEAYPDAAIQIIGEYCSPYTTSDVAAGLWGPYLFGNTTEAVCRKWAQTTHDYFHHLWSSGQADPCGICLVSVTELFADPQEPIPWWHDIVLGFQELTYESLQVLEREHNATGKYATGFTYVTFTCEPTKLMDYYCNILTSKRNVKFHQKHIEGIECLNNLNIDQRTIIINCLGLGAGPIFNDTDLEPIRGQVQKVLAQGVFHSIANNSSYIIPNTATITLGGTKQKSHITQVCPSDRYSIRKNCEAIVPALKHATVVRDIVGLRPVRSTGVRLQIGTVNGTFGKRTIVHNYGHGGAGITLAWGCARDVVQLVQNENNQLQNIRSKL
ncbi:D-amino-acid oxidase-like [Anopheles bellator]|uniref:D-amino-acid oxidase-like n=1 Tax=Anopheles bellator TaxID=139047 RepID=UPI00264989FC|nr:D-amino-acid oxidase-like [Anopheles bellator]